jgi:hypothetical protein
MSKRIAILQSNYIPWKGYFDLINMVDEFILFDDVQYTKNDWRNRNVIKTNQGLRWLTIPVNKGNLHKRIKDTKVSDQRWRKRHWASLTQSYSKSPYFNHYKEFFAPLFLEARDENLSEINYRFINVINEILGIKTRIRWSSEFDMIGGRTKRLLHICKQCGATEYLSGPAAKSYFDLELANQNQVQVTWIDYKGYQEYPQLYPPFEHNVTVLDLIFNAGCGATKFMKSFDL